MSKCLNVAQGLKFKTDFHSKMSVCRHELGVEPPAIPTLLIICHCELQSPKPDVAVSVSSFYISCFWLRVLD